MKKILLGLSAIAFCFTTSVYAQTKAPIQLIKGQKFVVESKNDATSSTEVQGQSMETKINVASVYNIEVKDKSANYLLSNTLTSMKMGMNIMGQDHNFDSNNPDDMKGEIGSGLKDYINNPKEVQITQTGEVVTNPKDSASAPGGQLAMQIKNLETSGYGSTLAFQSLPKDLKVGTTWADSSTENGISKNLNYTVKQIDGNIATVTFDGTISTDLKMENQGMEISTKASGKLSGQETIDIKTGIIQTNTTTTDQKGTVSAMGQEMPTSATGTMTTTVKSL